MSDEDYYVDEDDYPDDYEDYADDDEYEQIELDRLLREGRGDDWY